MAKNKTGIRFELHISNDITVTLHAENMKSFLQKINATNKRDLHLIDSIASDHIYRKLYEYACNYVLSDKYKAILMSDAKHRMQEDGLGDFSDVSDYVNWCWGRNAGHWEDGTPITDD